MQQRRCKERVIKSIIRIVDSSKPGKSFSSERKRVRCYLLQAYQPFIDDLVKLEKSLVSYETGVDEELLDKVQRKWRVNLDFYPKSLLEGVEEGVSSDYRETLSSRVGKGVDWGDPIENPPFIEISDTRYLEPLFCEGAYVSNGFDFGDTSYVMIPKTLSLKEGVKALKTLGLREEKGYLTNTDDEGLSEAAKVLYCMTTEKLNIAATVREINGELSPENKKSKSTRYSKLYKQMLEIFQPLEIDQQNS